jgi:imidazolonepropionase-like amidohydrolase
MARTLFTNVRVFDGSGDAPYPGEVLVDDNRIAAVAPSAQPVDRDGAEVVDGRGATLMPGLCDAHTHFSWTNQPDLHSIGLLPVEEHVLAAMGNAKTYLDSGYTMCVGAAAAKPRLDVVIRNAINKGRRLPLSEGWATSILRTSLLTRLWK